MADVIRRKKMEAFVHAAGGFIGVTNIRVEDGSLVYDRCRTDKRALFRLYRDNAIVRMLVDKASEGYRIAG